MAPTRAPQRKAGVWPVCTVPGCEHAHSWPGDTFDRHPTAVQARLEASEFRRWIDRATGEAVCACHGDGLIVWWSRFPCDRWLASNRDGGPA